MPGRCIQYLPSPFLPADDRKGLLGQPSRNRQSDAEIPRNLKQDGDE
jgi:hypothetical protein